MSQRILLGDKSGTKGFWVAKASKSVFSTTLEDYLVDSQSEQSVPFIRGSLNSMPYQGDTTDGVNVAHFYQAVVAHNLGYVPFVWSWKDYDGTAFAPTLYVNGPPHYILYFDNTNYVFNGWIPFTTGSAPAPSTFTLGFTLRYIIFKNKGS